MMFNGTALSLRRCWVSESAQHAIDKISLQYFWASTRSAQALLQRNAHIHAPQWRDTSIGRARDGCWETSVRPKPNEQHHASNENIETSTCQPMIYDHNLTNTDYTPNTQRQLQRQRSDLIAAFKKPSSKCNNPQYKGHPMSP